MSSKKTLDVDFERDMPLTAAALEALARSRQLRPLTTETYLNWLTLMSKGSRPVHRLNSDSDEPFEL
jgi:hypothetical protein